MSKTKLFLLGLSLVVLGNCTQKDDVGTVNLIFSALYDGQPLVMNQVVDYDGSSMRINVSEFFISEIKLIGSGGERVIGDTRYVDFTSSAGDQVELKFYDVPNGTYDVIEFSVGIPADKNAMKPEDFSSDHPLSRSSSYWQGWQSYIFSKLEGKLDTAGSGVTDLTFIYHSGKDDLYTKVVVQLNSPFVVDEGSQTLNLAVEHQALFKQDGGYLDINAKPTAHNPDDLEYPSVILENFKTGISLD